MFAQIIQFIIMPIVWVPIVAILGFLGYRNYKKLNRLKVLNVDSVLLMLEIPRANDKKELAAEQLFASLHGILRDKAELKNSGGIQEHLSFEIVSTGGQIRFYVWVPKILQNFVEGQIYAHLQNLQINNKKLVKNLIHTCRTFLRIARFENTRTYSTNLQNV